MFESVNRPVTPRRNRMATLAASLIAHATVIVLLIIAPLLYFTNQLPKPPDMLAFVVASAPPPPPPPPPPPAAPQKPHGAKPKTARKPVETRVVPAPVEAPQTIEPERLPEVPVQQFGVEGGVPGGIAGGIVGGLAVMPAPPPPPPPPPAAPPKPVRIGGDIQQPTLVHRVNPEYPPIAISARKEGIVILEATVDEHGAVERVRVLRSEPLLDKAAIDAVKQWRYSPLQLNGRAHPFILTVTVSFNL